MRPLGFSTGAIAKGNFRGALTALRRHHIRVVELSALRVTELESLFLGMPELDLGYFHFVSIHAPSRFPEDSEPRIVDLLASVAGRRFPIVVHPDVIFTPSLWERFEENLFIENMDKRKPIGRTVRELSQFFEALPKARFCFDLGHARQIDPSMTESLLLLRAFGNRLAEVHVSEVNTASRHDPISLYATRAFQGIAPHVPEETPIIIESLIDEGQSDIATELQRTSEALGATAGTAAL